MSTHVTQDLLLQTIVEDFGPALDKYGYERGYRVKIFERVYVEYVPCSGIPRTCWGTPAGTWFDLRLQNLRRRPGGEWSEYQAYTDTRGKFTTMEAAEASARKGIEATRKRLAKK